MKLHKLYLILLALCLPATSCIFMDEDESPVVVKQGEELKIQFVFNALLNTTRANSDDQKPGENMENYIDVEQTQFFLFTNAHTVPGELPYLDEYLAKLEPTNVRSTGSESSPTWTVEAVISNADNTPLSLEQLQAGYKIVCIANAAAPAPNAGEHLDTYLSRLTYNFAESKAAASATAPYYPFAGETDEDMRIPMYGVLSVGNDKRYSPGFMTNVGQLKLLRAISKIEIKFDETTKGSDNVTLKTDGFKILSATLNNYYPSGRIAPDGIYVDTNEWDEYESAPNHLYMDAGYVHIPDGVSPTIGANLPFHVMPREGKEGRRAVIYVPEYNNTNSPNKLEIDLNVQSKSGIEINKKIYVCEYTEGEPKMDNTDPTNPKFAQLYNLVRNHILSFELSGNNTFLYVVQVGMQSWETVPGNYEIYNW